MFSCHLDARNEAVVQPESSATLYEAQQLGPQDPFADPAVFYEGRQYRQKSGPKESHIQGKDTSSQSSSPLINNILCQLC